ncbi:hypothetical protein WBO40_16775, partial [Lysobacter sp. CCNWLW52]
FRMDILVHSKNGARPARRPSGLRLLAWVRGYGFQCRGNGNGNGNSNSNGDGDAATGALP